MTLPRKVPWRWVRWCGRTTLRLALFDLALRAAIAAQAADEAKELRPPRPPLVPSFLDQHGWLLVVLGLLVLAGAALTVWWLRRPKVTIGTPPDVLARQALRSLRGQTEDAVLALRVSQEVRRYLHVALDQPGEELTTAEVGAAVRGHPLGGEELAGPITALLRDCDLWKFAPVTPTAATGLVERAIGLTEQIEARRPLPNAATAPPKP